MSNPGLLKQYIKLMVETVTSAPAAPLQLTGPFQKAKSGGGFGLYRTFPVAPTPELLAALQLDETDLDEAGMITGEHEIIIDLDDVYYTKGSRGSYEYPGDPQEFLVEGYSIIAFDGLTLTPQDEMAVKKYLGDLTDEEQDKAFEYWKDASWSGPYDD